MTNKVELREIRERLKSMNYRLTPQREAVVKVLLDNTDDHLKAEDIYAKTKVIASDIGLATVYRTLELLEKLDIIYRFEYGDGQSRYELGRKSEKHYHHHLICLKCGEISEFNDDLLEKLEEKIAVEKNFKITDHSLKFFGICSKCSK